jgi:hypothetical protein
MLTIEPFQRRWLLTFGATLALLLSGAVALSLRLPSFREPAFNFYAMQPGQIFNVYGLTRRQEGSVKLGFAEAYPAPEIGAYGNHIIAFFGADAFDRPEEAEYFFNYYYANLSLPEIRRYLLRVARLNHLPKKLILVQVTPPNADNGGAIIDRGNELPPDVLLSSREDDRGLDGPLPLMALSWELIINWLHEILNYNTVVMSLFQRGGYEERTLSPANCHENPPAWLSRLPVMLQSRLGTYGGLRCVPRLWSGALRRDGSQLVAGPETRTPLVQNENALKETERALRAGDEQKIAHEMQAIDAIGRRYGVKVVFIVPPVYETDRHDSVVNQILDRALALVPDVAVVDHRNLHSDASLFEGGIHASAQYYRILVEELRRRGVVNSVSRNQND